MVICTDSELIYSAVMKTLTALATGLIKMDISRCPRLLKWGCSKGQMLQRCVLQCLLDYHFLLCSPQRAKSLI